MAKGKAIVSMKEVEKQMEVYATSGEARVLQPGGNTIGIRNSKFTYKQEVIGVELFVIALDFVHVNAWYDQKFDPDNPAPPACFAISEDGKEMAPFPQSPVNQHDVCDGCPQNAWGSAEQGRGKSCKNQYRVACMETDGDPEEAEIAILSLPPTSMRNWTMHVKDVKRKLNRPVFGVVTQFTFDVEEEWPVLLMETDKVIDDPVVISAIMARIEDVRSALNEPFDVSGYEPPKKGKKPEAKSKSKSKAKAKAKPKSKRSSKFS